MRYILLRPDMSHDVVTITGANPSDVVDAMKEDIEYTGQLNMEVNPFMQNSIGSLDQSVMLYADDKSKQLNMWIDILVLIGFPMIPISGNIILAGRPSFINNQLSFELASTNNLIQFIHIMNREVLPDPMFQAPMLEHIQTHHDVPDTAPTMMMPRNNRHRGGRR